jgi:hypothetical protein
LIYKADYKTFQPYILAKAKRKVLGPQMIYFSFWQFSPQRPAPIDTMPVSHSTGPHLSERDRDGRVREEVVVAERGELLLLRLDPVEQLPDLGGRQDDPGVVLPRDPVTVAADGADLTWNRFNESVSTHNLRKKLFF